MRFKALPASVKAAPRPSSQGPTSSPPSEPRKRRDWIATIPIVLLLPALVFLGGQVGARSTDLQAPSTAEPGDRIVVVGRNLPANTRLQLVWDGSTRSMPTARTDRRGNLRVRLTVPDRSSAGTHTISVARVGQSRASNWRRDGWTARALASTRLRVVMPVGDEPTAAPTAARVVAPSASATAAATEAAPTPTARPTSAPATAAPTPQPTPRPATPAPTTAPPPPPAPAPPPATGINGRPFTAGSAWNTPIAAGAAVDPNSATMIAGLGQHNGGRITSDPNQYSYPVYFADANTPRHDVRCTSYKCTVVSPSGVSTMDTLRGVPIPAGATASAGSDAQIIIIDVTNGNEYDLWQVRQGGSGWSVSNGSVYNIYWDGMPSRYGSRGAGVPYYAGLIRPWEIAAGRIDHAIAFAYPSPARNVCVWPASKTDGNSSSSNAIPEGARLQLDPSLTDADFSAWGLDRTGRIIARALQQYGMILIDVSGRPKIYAENLIANPHATASWTDPAIRLTDNTITAIPHTAFRVLDLPDGSGGQHGQCLR